MTTKANNPVFKKYAEAAQRAAEDLPLANELDLLSGLRTGSWLDQQTFDPIRWMVPGLLPEGATVLCGGPKVGKSWLAYGVGLGCAGGGRVLGALQVQQRPVLMLALEDGDRRLQSRARQLLGDGEPLPAAFSYMTRIEPGMAIATIEMWLDRLPEDSPEPLVIIDTLGKVMPPADASLTTYERDYKVAGGLKRIADDRPGMALWALHHDRKAHSDDFVQMVSGTNGIAGAFDTIMLLNRKRLEETGLLKITGRDVSEHEYAVTSSLGPWRLTGESLADAAREAETTREAESLGDRAASILRFVNQQSGKVTPLSTAKALGLDNELVSKYLVRLADSGKVLKISRGVYRCVESVESVQMPRPEWTLSTDSTQVERTDEPVAPLSHRGTCDTCGIKTRPNFVKCDACTARVVADAKADIERFTGGRPATYNRRKI